MRRLAILLLAVPAGASAEPLAPVAFRIADQPLVTHPRAWKAAPIERSFAEIAGSTARNRQSVRWKYARSLIAAGRSAEALGVLDTMAVAEPDLLLVDNFQLARGRVLVELGHLPDAAAALDRHALGGSPEACAWRIRAIAGTSPATAVRLMNCARTALNARSTADRTPFLIAAARAAMAVGDPVAAERWLGFASRADPAANLLKAEALLEQHRAEQAEKILEPLAHAHSPEVRAEAEGLRIEALLAEHRLKPAKALERLERLTYVWRGDAVERRALWLRWELAHDSHDPAVALPAAATLIRYHQPGPRLPPLMAGVSAIFFEMLRADSRVPLPRAAGLYWDYRDLAPSGADGDALVVLLADRLQALGLYARSAALLEHQLFGRARDVAQGPLSVRVAKLHILAGEPDRALDALRSTAATLFPAAMLDDRKRIEAVALHQLGRDEEALAVLEHVAGTAALRSEILWRAHDWDRLATAQAMPARGPLNELQEAVVLRQAIALAMLGREDRLAELRTRFSPAFEKLRSGRAFALLTKPRDSAEGSEIGAAMAAMPSASPAGVYADLMDAAPPSATPPQRR